MSKKRDLFRGRLVWAKDENGEIKVPRQAEFEINDTMPDEESVFILIENELAD